MLSPGWGKQGRYPGGGDLEEEGGSSGLVWGSVARGVLRGAGVGVGRDALRSSVLSVSRGSQGRPAGESRAPLCVRRARSGGAWVAGG